MSEEKWEIRITRSKPRKGKIQILFDGKVIKSDPIGFEMEGETLVPNALKVHTFQAMVDTFNLEGWNPSYMHVVMSAARILQDGLQGRHNRRIAHVNARGKLVFVAVHTGCFFTFTRELKPISFESSEMGVNIEFNEEEREQFVELIDEEILAKRVADSLANKLGVQRGDRAKDRVTARMKKIAAQQARLDAWNHGQGISEENP